MSLLARYADHLFWLARYLERTASLARIIETHLAFDRGRDEDVSWAWLVTLHNDEERFRKAYDEASFKNVIRFYLADMDNHGSVRFALRAARENARALRAVIPTEMWVHLNEFYNRYLVMTEADLDPIRIARTCEQIKSGCYAQLGVAESTLYRDEGWRFFRLGLMIERADQTSRLLDVKFAQLATGLSSPAISSAQAKADDDTFWSLVLRSAVAYQAFRRFEPRGADADRVARFLLVNSSHPRSAAYCLMEVQRLLGELRSGFGLRRVGTAQEQSEALLELLQAAAADASLATRLHAVNDQLQRRLIELTAELGRTFFGYPEPAMQSQSQEQS
ncbi:MAG: alpha-E domain-containing protein [Hyphomicrobiaceae bacterium]|nr:alpha-E domain-containing protein [Hyphomicrobiaceae bacterium]